MLRFTLMGRWTRWFRSGMVWTAIRTPQRRGGNGGTSAERYPTPVAHFEAGDAPNGHVGKISLQSVVKMTHLLTAPPVQWRTLEAEIVRRGVNQKTAWRARQQESPNPSCRQHEGSALTPLPIIHQLCRRGIRVSRLVDVDGTIPSTDPDAVASRHPVTPVERDRKMLWVDCQLDSHAADCLACTASSTACKSIYRLAPAENSVSWLSRCGRMAALCTWSPCSGAKEPSTCVLATAFFTEAGWSASTVSEHTVTTVWSLDRRCHTMAMSTHWGNWVADTDKSRTDAWTAAADELRATPPGRGQRGACAVAWAAQRLAATWCVPARPADRASVCKDVEMPGNAGGDGQRKAVVEVAMVNNR